MTGIYKHRLFWRFLALAVLILCFSVLSRSAIDAPLAITREASPTSVQTQAPRLSAQPQTGTPILISSPRVLSINEQFIEFSFDLINVSGKPVRAYAIKQHVEGEGPHSSKVSFSSLDMTRISVLQPKQLITNFDTYHPISTKEEHIILSVDYAEFSDGTKWGVDSANFADHSAGQRAASHIVSKRLLIILNASNAGDVLSTIESGAANIEPPPSRSDEWKQGFRLGFNSIVGRLKRAQKHGGLSQVERELRHMAERFKRID